MSWNPAAVMTQLVDLALVLGQFERVNAHEPKNAPGKGLTCAIWADRIDPALSSGLASTSIRVSFKARVYRSMITEPQDAIDPDMLAAVTGLYTSLHTDLDLSGLARIVDVLGSERDDMYAEAGYLDIGGRMFRVMTINIPVIFNDAFDQAI